MKKMIKNHKDSFKNTTFNIEVPLKVKGKCIEENDNYIKISFSEETLKRQLRSFTKSKLMHICLISRGWIPTGASNGDV